jgi:hypothetical protein
VLSGSVAASRGRHEADGTPWRPVDEEKRRPPPGIDSG